MNISLRLPVRAGVLPEDILAAWDPILVMLSENNPAFLTVLTEEMVNELASPGNSDPKGNLYCERVYTWLDHIMSAEDWEFSREKLSLSYLLASCHDHPNNWTTRLRELLLSIQDNHGPMENDNSQRVNSEELKIYGWESV
jgi:hypothetical protein